MQKINRRAGAAKYEELAERYFTACHEGKQHPSLPGLALALGFATRHELEQLARKDSRAAGALRKAMTRVEEATVQSAFTRDCAANAKFILQNGFGYSEKAVLQPPEEIRVMVGGEAAE